MFKGGMASMMQKAQKMQQDMQKAQSEIKNLSATGNASGGAVEVTINGQYMATNININRDVIDDKEMLEDLVLIAINDAVEQISKASSEKMKGATGGMELPSGMNLPF